MGKIGEKQKRTPKLKDKKQSERFKEAARALGADEHNDALDRLVKEMAKPDPTKKRGWVKTGIKIGRDDDAS